MKKLFFAALAVCGMAACNSDSETHIVQFINGTPNLYADQSIDTLYVYATDSWTATSSATWLTIDKGSESLTIPAGSAAFSKMALTAAPNTTGALRTAYIQASSPSASGYYVVSQAYWLNVTRPTAVYDSELKKATFGHSITWNTLGDTIAFQNYTDGATLTSDASWIQPQTTATYDAGEHTVYFTVEQNATGADRTATLTLTSAGVSTPITVVQKKQ